MRISLIATALLVGLTVLGLAARSEAQAPIVANFGTVAPDGTPWAEQLKAIKARIESESKGRIQIKLFMGGTLGGENEMVRMIRRNDRLQGGGFSTAAIAEGANAPLLQIPELPYLFQNEAEADFVMDTVLWDPISKDLLAKGFVLMAWTENGWRSFGTKGGPATTPDELKKFKMRVQEVDVHQQMYAALGVQAQPLPVTEVLTSLKTGVVTGFDNTPLFTQAAGWHEGITHYNLSKHIYQPAAVVWAKAFYDSLTPDLQKIVMGDRMAEAATGRAGVRALEAELIANFPSMNVKVVPLTDAQRAAFAAKTKAMHATYAASVTGGTDVLNKVNAALKTKRGQ